MDNLAPDYYHVLIDTPDGEECVKSYLDIRSARAHVARQPESLNARIIRNREEVPTIAAPRKIYKPRLSKRKPNGISTNYDLRIYEGAEADLWYKFGVLCMANKMDKRTALLRMVAAEVKKAWP